MYFQSILAFLEDHLKRWPQFYLVFLCFLLSISWYLTHKNKVITHWPIVGILPSLLQNAHRVHDWTVDITNTFGCTKSVCGPIFGRLEILFTCDPRNVEYIYRTNFPNFPKGSDYIKTFDILGNGLFNVDSDLWHAQRNMARTIFASKKFQCIVANVSRKVVKDSLLPLMSHVARESSIVDLEDVFLRYTFDTTFTALFGIDPKYLSPSFPANEFAQAMDDVLEAIFYRHVMPISWWKLCRLLMIGKERKLDKAWKTMDRYLAQYISLKKKDLHKGGGGGEEVDLLTTYMNLQHEEINDWFAKGDKFLRDTALTFFFAGRDTTGAGLAWFFWLISKNPHVEEKILEELKLVLSKKMKDGLREKNPCVFDSEDLKGSMYLHAALCESLRLYPPLPLNRKGALREDVLPDGTIVKPGMMIIISKFVMARMEWLWGKDCSEFKPERWIDEDGKLNHEAQHKFLTFGIGPRTCLGRGMAFTLMKTAAASMLFNYHVQVVEGQIFCPKPSIVLHMKNGLMGSIKPRLSFNG